MRRVRHPEKLRKRLFGGKGLPTRRIEVRLIEGKSNEVTKWVDQKAKAAGRIPTHVDWGFTTGKIGRSIRIYHSAVARRDIQVFKFQEYDEAKRDFFEKFEAYSEASVGNELHRMHVYRVRMNDLPRYPKILEILEELKEAQLLKESVVV